MSEVPNKPQSNPLLEQVRQAIINHKYSHK